MVNLVVAIITLLLSGYATAFTQSYCSSQNTGSGSPFFWTYQTNGKCTDHCNALGTYAFAVIQFTNCWCTNYIPATTTDISDCQVDCPGYPSEKCGDKDAGLYIYIEGNGQPSGTAGGGGSSKPSSTAVSSSTPVPSSTDSPSTSDVATPSPASPSQRPTSRGRPPITVTQTVVGDSPVMTVTPSQPSTSSSSSATSSSAPNKPSSTLQTVATSSATAMSTSVQVITESGAVVTRTIIYQPTAAASQPQASNSSSSNTGAIVGGVVGGVAAILAIVGGILFFLWRRRKQQRAEQDQQAGITRNVSTMSKAGLLGGRVATDRHHPPPIATSVSHAGSRHDNESISPGSQRRYSQPMMIDSRLNPETVLMYHPTFGNSSRDSLGSIDDSRDFGRQLNVRNPDPH